MKKKLLRILLIIVILAGGACFYYYLPTGNTKTTEITNPASVFCQQNSGTLEITTDLN
jgi:putative hemolysin